MFTGSSWEVAVHAMVVELDVCVTRVFGDGRRTWFGVVLASSDLSVSILARVAVYVSFSERYLTNPRFPGATVVELGESEFFGGRHGTCSRCSRTLGLVGFATTVVELDT